MKYPSQTVQEKSRADATIKWILWFFTSDLRKLNVSKHPKETVAKIALTIL